MSQIIEYIKEKKILILGYGREGISTYNYIRKHLPEKKITIADELLNSIEPYDLQKTDPAVYELYDKLNSLFMNINRY